MGQPDPTFVWPKWAWVKKARVHFWTSFFRPGPTQKYGSMNRPIFDSSICGRPKAEETWETTTTWEEHTTTHHCH